MGRQLLRGQFMGTLNRSVSAGGFEVDLRVATLPPEAVEEHSHDVAHFILPLADGYRSLARDPLTGRTVFAAGSVIYNPPGVVHRDCFDVAGGLFLSVSVPADMPGGLDHPTLLRGAAETAMRQLVGLSLNAQEGDRLLVEDLSLTLTGAVADGHDSSRHAPDWLATAVEMVADLSTIQGLEIRQIAAEVAVHPVYLARAWRRHFGQSPGTAIRHRRADQAAVQLTRGLSLADVAATAGYADQSHMTREYVHIFGLTPGSFRASVT
ncbi:helix-turn-helix domain-containing protein [Brevundimonas sp.]